MGEKWVTDKWYVSRFNFVDEVQGAINLPERVIITDCTLRDGEQQAGVVFTKEDKVKIARKLDEIGIHQIEAGTPAVSKEDEEAIRAIMKEGLKAKVYANTRAMKQDVDKAIDTGVLGVQIGIPISHVKRQPHGWSEEKVIDMTLEITDYAKDHGLWVNLSPYDTTRADLNFLRRYLREVIKKGHVDRVRLVDSYGSAIPPAMRYLVRVMKEVIGGMPLEVHCHNDFGLATTNTLAGVEAGAEAVSCTINGIGERVGNARTEEVALALKLLYGFDLELKYEKFYEISKLVEKVSRVKLQSHKPIVGDGAFTWESGSAVAGIVAGLSPFTSIAFLPEFVGRKRKIVLGKKAGTKNIEFKLKELGISLSEDQIRELLRKVKEESMKKKALISDKRFKEMFKEYI